MEAAKCVWQLRGTAELRTLPLTHTHNLQPGLTLTTTHTPESVCEAGASERFTEKKKKKEQNRQPGHR